MMAIIMTAIIVIPVSVKKNTPREKKTCGTISFRSTKSGSGEQFLLQDCRAKAGTKGVLFSQTPETGVVLPANLADLKQRTNPEMGIGKPLVVSQLLKRRLLK